MKNLSRIKFFKKISKYSKIAILRFKIKILKLPFFSKLLVFVFSAVAILVLLISFLKLKQNQNITKDILPTTPTATPTITYPTKSPTKNEDTATDYVEDDKFNGSVVISYKGEIFKVSGENKTKNIGNKNFSELKQFNGFPQTWDNDVSSRIIDRVIYSKDNNQVILRLANIDKTKPINEMTNYWDPIPDKDYLCDFISKQCAITDLLSNIEKDNKYMSLTGFETNEKVFGAIYYQFAKENSNQAIVYDLKTKTYKKTPIGKDYYFANGFYDDSFNRVALSKSDDILDIFFTDDLNKIKNSIDLSGECISDKNDGLRSLSWSDKYIAFGTGKNICLVDIKTNKISKVYTDTTPTGQVWWNFNYLQLDYPYIYFVDYISDDNSIESLPKEQILKSINLENGNSIKSLLTKPMNNIFSDSTINIIKNGLYIPSYWDEK